MTGTSGDVSRPDDPDTPLRGLHSDSHSARIQSFVSLPTRSLPVKRHGHCRQCQQRVARRRRATGHFNSVVVRRERPNFRRRQTRLECADRRTRRSVTAIPSEQAAFAELLQGWGRLLQRRRGESARRSSAGWQMSTSWCRLMRCFFGKRLRANAQAQVARR